MAELTVAAGLARGLVKLAVSRGVAEATLVTRAGIDPDALHDQDNRIPLPAYVRLTRAAKELTNEPALALHYGETIDLAELSIAGLIMAASETVSDAFVQMNRFGRLAIEVECIGDRFKLARDSAGHWLVDTRMHPNEFVELTETTFARQVCGTRRFMPRPHVLEVHVTHAAPAYRAEYDRIFRCPVVFESHWNAMRLDATLATHRIALHSRYVFGVLIDRAEELLEDLERSKSTRGRVETLLLPILHTGEVSMDVIAKKLAIGRQTLYRQLKAEGTSFERVLDELRHKMALHYLGGAKVSVNETAYLVGFSDPTAFARAFKRWTGMAPSAMRASMMKR